MGKSTLLLVVGMHMLGAGLILAEPAAVVGDWSVEAAFGNGENRSLRFEAQAGGKGAFSVQGPGPNQVGTEEPATGEWTRSEDGAVRFSGAVQFPRGNVALERGTLVLTGKVGGEGAIAGEAMFYPAGQDPKDPGAKASKSGTFKAVRLAGR